MRGGLVLVLLARLLLDQSLGGNMRNFKKTRIGIVWPGVGICMLLISILGCKEPVERQGPSFDGSAKWAFGKAQPVINTFANDSKVYSILGSMIMKSGRLPANTGAWSFVSWSPSLKKECQVNIDYQGKATKSIKDLELPPNTASGGPLPVGWVNSDIIFSSIPGSEVSSSYATLVVFNFTNFPQAPNLAVWGISFSNGGNQLVRWDGYYLGPQ